MTESVVSARHVAAPVERVWRVWTEGERFARWLAPTPETKVRVLAFDPRPGGEWRVEMVEPDGARWTGGGRFVEVEPRRRLAMTWAWAHRPDESLVEAEFAPAGSGTQVVVTHSRLRTRTERDENDAGWKAARDALAAAAALTPA